MKFDFALGALPQIHFGHGVLEKIPELVKEYGNNVLVVTGRQSFQQSPQWQSLQKVLSDKGCTVQSCNIPGEPSPELVDELSNQFRDQDIDVVLGIGGGSALDAAKAIAGLLRIPNSVMDFLEGVGPELPYPGPAVPFIAVPTTAGTGSEATKNAVLSRQGKDGFKKSFRDNQLVANYAVVDPGLLASCPPQVIAANGMDALTQLLESFVSLKSNRFIDAIAISGLRAARDGLVPFYEGGSQAHDAQEKMAYAALASGITLAQVGLGSVHGLASPLGAFYPIPHGVVCGTLVATATEINIQSMLRREPDNPGLDKYARAAEILCQKRIRDREAAWEALIALLQQWTEALALPRLGTYDIGADDIDHIVQHSRGSSMHTNPIVLSDDEIRQILLQRL